MCSLDGKKFLDLLIQISFWFFQLKKQTNKQFSGQYNLDPGFAEPKTLGVIETIFKKKKIKLRI